MSYIAMHLDRASPVPLYHQIAETIRYRIATGQLHPGDPLPSLADAASRWGVNLHTVRRAYGELREAGYVETGRRAGTRVNPSGVPRAASEEQTTLQRFIWRVVREARERFQLAAPEVADAILQTAAPRGSDVITVVECSETQAADYAQQIAERWKVVAEPWSLEWAGEPPPGRILSTYFHYNDVRRRWPERGADFVFLAVRPDAHLRRALERRASPDRLVDVVLCESDESRAHTVTADLILLFPRPPFRVETHVVTVPAALLRDRPNVHVVFPPRIWSQLPADAHASPRAHQLRYVFETGDLEALGHSFGWAPAHRPPTMAKIS